MGKASRLARGFAAAALLAAAASASARDYPAVSVDYFVLFDRSCAEMAREPLDEAAVKELQERLGAFRDFWSKEEPVLMGAVVPVTGVPFRFAETRAALATCGFQSMSLPLIVNMRPYLAATAKGRVAPMVDFSNTLFHEAMHRYVADAIRELPGETTPLLRKYAAENVAVRNHMHLFAIERLVYRRIGREKDLDAVVATENTFRGAQAFQRARAIVAEEGAEALVKELSGGRRP